MIDTLGHGLIFLFTGIPGIGDAMAFYIACSLVGAAVIIAVRYRRNHHWPLLDAINQRNGLISERIGGREAPSDVARIAFADAYFDIDEKMMEASHEEVFHLRRAWEEYRETIVDPNSDVLHNTVRPENFFLGLGERHRALGWFANISIAVGLLFTFLGIIAALSTLDLSGGPDAMQSQLNELMQVAGAKFWASVGGIVASIILRSVDYRFAKKVDEGLARMCDLLEHGMAYLPPQRIAAEQLRQLEEQTPALRGFSEQLAVVLEQALEKQFTPMVSSLGAIQDGIDRISGGGGEAVRKALTESAGAEMGNLAEAIGGMTLSLGTMAERFEKQTNSADQQIEEAVRRFSQASDEMRAAFGELNNNFAAVAERMRADSEEASDQARQRMGDLLDRLGSSLDEMRTKMVASAGEFGEATQGAARQAAETGQLAMEDSFKQFVERFAEAGEPLVEEMRKASTSIGTAASSLDGSNRAMGDYTRGIESVADRSSDIATSLGSVASDVREAAEPVRQSAASIEKAMLAMSAAVANDARNSEAAREEMRELSGTLQSTAESAEKAWSDYRDRFNEVDEALGKALTLLSEAAGSHAQNLNERVGQVDDALSKGIAQLAAALRPLESLSDTVEDLAAALAAQQARVDE
jgi:methyl-accepting chemotaxis protein